MLRFGAPAMRPRALLERPDDLLIDPANQQIGHIRGSKTDAINDSIGPSLLSVADRLGFACGRHPVSLLGLRARLSDWEPFAPLIVSLNS